MISVVIPVYNASKYLRNCVASVLAQTYCELEIILVDDGSKDESPDICDELAKENPRIRTIHKSNGGSASARNAGISLANGDFVSFIDADDYIDSNMYSDMMKEMSNSKITIVSSGISVIDANGNNIYSAIYEKTEYSGKQALSELFSGSGKLNASSCTKLFRKELFEKVGCFVTSIDHEDTEFTVRALGASDTVVVLSNAYYHYVKHLSSKTSNKFFNVRGYNFLFELDKYKKTCKKNHPDLLPKFYLYELETNRGMLKYIEGCLDYRKNYCRIILIMLRIVYFSMEYYFFSNRMSNNDNSDSNSI